MAIRPLLLRLTFLDRAILLALLLAAGALFPLLGRGGAGERVVVEQDGRIVFTAPLSGERTASLTGPLGETVLAIHDGSARIVSSSCPHRICLGMGGVSQRGDIVACVPNRLLVRIEGRDEGSKDYDLLSR